MPPKSRRLVIDTSIAQSSGGEKATHSTSVKCRDFLQKVLDTPHKAVFSSELQEEWNRHQSRFARTWRSSMVARRRLIILDNKITNAGLGAKLDASTTVESDKAAMQKDAHLLEAALATDETIVARDEEVKRLFAQSSRNIKELQEIVWVNPDNDEEQAINWLENGALPDETRKLKNFKTS